MEKEDKCKRLCKINGIIILILVLAVLFIFISNFGAPVTSNSINVNEKPPINPICLTIGGLLIISLCGEIFLINKLKTTKLN